MATGTINGIKHTDVTITMQANSSFASTASPVNGSRIISLVLLYSDDVYYSPPVIGYFTTDNLLTAKLTSSATATRHYNIRVFYI